MSLAAVVDIGLGEPVAALVIGLELPQVQERPLRIKDDAPSEEVVQRRLGHILTRGQLGHSTKDGSLL